MKLSVGAKKEINKAYKEAQAAALDAGTYIHSKFGKHKNLTEKPDTSLVTEVDKTSEALILKRLRKKFTSHHFVGEETGSSLSEILPNSSFSWHIDPLDGTTNFVHGFPMFCTSIGLVFEEKHFVCGVIYHPILKQLHKAAVGHGAFTNNTPIRVSKTKKLQHALLSTGFSMRRNKEFAHEIADFESLASHAHGTRRTGSAAMDLVYVARGNFDGFWERGLNTWDVSAGICLIEQAGGKVTQMSGGKYVIGSPTILATNGLVHPECLKVFKK